MKFLFSLCIVFFACSYASAQKLSPKKAAVIKALNVKAKEAVGNLRFQTGAKTKVTIEEASFTATDMGVKIEAVLGVPTTTKTSHSSEFNPADIVSITETSFPDASPVGQLSIKLDYKLGHKTSYHKQDGLKESYEDIMTFNFLKVDEDNYDEIKELLMELKDLYIKEASNKLKPLTKLMNDDKEFWVSGEGASNTYELLRVNITDCTMRLVYYLKSIKTSGDMNQMYITIVPLSDIDDIKLDKGKSKPNCIMLQSGKKGFETYELKDKIYVLSKPVKQIPLFIDVTYDWRLEETMETLKTAVRECDGKKLKL